MGFMCGFPVQNPTLFELIVLRTRIQMAIHNNILHLDINIDLLEVVSMLKHEHVMHANIIHECRSLIQTVGNPVVEHVFREKN